MITAAQTAVSLAGEAYLDRAAVARLLGVKPKTIAAWFKSGTGPACIPINRRKHVYLRSAVESWVASRSVVSHAEAKSRGLV